MSARARWFETLLLLWVVASATVMVIGLGMSLAGDGSPTTSAVALSQLTARLARADAAAYLTLGLLMLVATPALRLVLAVIDFGLSRDWRFVGAALAVMAVVVAGIVASTLR